eukprot:jgi/Bigna1/76551/fgenesh1_pg.42_\
MATQRSLRRLASATNVLSFFLSRSALRGAHRSGCRSHTRRGVATAAASMSEDERYLFDLNGFLVLRGVFSEEEVSKANDAIDRHLEDVIERQDPSLRNTREKTPLAGDGETGRMDLGGMLGWEQPYCDPFRKMLADPRLAPYYNSLVGTGYRLDHQPLVILQEKGSEGFCMHGGTIDCSSGKYNQHLAYGCHNGMLTNSLLGVSLQLSDHNEGDGGFMIVRGSHKSNFRMPQGMIDGESYVEHIHQPVTKKGDVVIFSEGTVHGAKAWRADHQRRIALFRFAPPTMAYGRLCLMRNECLTRFLLNCFHLPRGLKEDRMCHQEFVFFYKLEDETV